MIGSLGWCENYDEKTWLGQYDSASKTSLQKWHDYFDIITW